MPTIIGMPTSSARSARNARQNIMEDGGGIKICCCRMFTCVNVNFLTTNHGLMKVSEVILATCCYSLLIRFGQDSAKQIGEAFNSCLKTVTSCLFTSGLLLFCYIISTRTFNLVRQSIFVSIQSCWCIFRSFSGHSVKRFEKLFLFYIEITGNLLQPPCQLGVFWCIGAYGI